MNFLLAVSVIGIIIVLFSQEAESDDLPETVVTRIDNNNPLQRLSVSTSMNQRIVRQAFVTNTVIGEEQIARQYIAAAWQGPNLIFNTSFLVNNGSIVYHEGGAGKQYYNVRVLSKPGLKLSWKGEIWTNV